jgi:glutamyl-tRNA reductase
MIGIIGLSHKSASLDVRECFAFNKDDVNKLSKCILSGSEVDGILILSTCNRTELYFTTKSGCLKGAMKHIDQCLHDYVRHSAVSKEFFYHLFDSDAVVHLFRLISGLESMVVGEYQIVSQIKEATSHAREQGNLGKVLDRLFTKALEVGKLVRTRTGISKGAFSVSYAAVEKCRAHFSDLDQRKILLVGAGETGELVVKNLYKRGCRFISIANRTIKKAQQLADRYGADIIPFAKLPGAVSNAEIVISSVSGEHLINKETISHSPEHKIMMIDLGVPRNIDPSLGVLKNLKLLNIDDLRQVVIQNEEKKKSYFNIAEEIIATKSDEFQDWLMSLRLAPTIRYIVSSVRQMHNDGLKNFSSAHSQEEVDAMEKYGRHLSEKVINTLVKNLKSNTENGRKEELVQMVNRLFD